MHSSLFAGDHLHSYACRPAAGQAASRYRSRGSAAGAASSIAIAIAAGGGRMEYESRWSRRDECAGRRKSRRKPSARSWASCRVIMRSRRSCRNIVSKSRRMKREVGGAEPGRAIRVMRLFKSIRDTNISNNGGGGGGGGGKDEGGREGGGKRREGSEGRGWEDKGQKEGRKEESGQAEPRERSDCRRPSAGSVLAYS